MPQDASPMVLGALGIGVLAVAVFWRWTQYLMLLVEDTLAATAALLTGVRTYVVIFAGKVRDVEFGGGMVASKGWWPSKVLVALIAVPAPSLVGLVVARGVEVGWNPRAVLAVLLVFLIIPFVYHPNWTWLLITVATAAVLALFVYRADPAAQLGATIALAWILLLGGLRWSAELAGLPKDRKATPADALQALTDIHVNVWILFFLLISISAFIAGARWLLF